MTSLAHWDFAENFSGNDAAALILGIEPRESDDDDDSPVRVVVDRMSLHYTHALKRHYQEAFNLNSEGFQDVDANRPLELESVKMDELRRHCDFQADVLPFHDWLAGNRSQFKYQTFSRRVVADWLTAMDWKSSYRFDLDQPSVDNKITGRWPWGDHHTELLGHLEAAALEFWVKYDPQNPKATAPKNDTVIAWLMARNMVGQKRKVSRQIAQAIATMLRPDGLPTGPRTQLSHP